MTTLTVTAKGQVTLRKDLLAHLGVQPGDRITVEKLPDGRIEAKAARPVVERIITLGKGDSLHTRRQAASYLLTPGATRKLFDDIAPRFADRPGGYTRIIHAGFRIGDGAQLAILELLGSKLKKKEKKEKKKVEAETEEPAEKQASKA